MGLPHFTNIVWLLNRKKLEDRAKIIDELLEKFKNIDKISEEVSDKK